ncbi:MAG: hypothetical protein MK212_19450 [Saprospiraceae bacterium]|nr:hypothetical protein [Saprospiraceae bacterium]
MPKIYHTMWMLFIFCSACNHIEEPHEISGEQLSKSIQITPEENPNVDYNLPKIPSRYDMEVHSFQEFLNELHNGVNLQLDASTFDIQEIAQQDRGVHYKWIGVQDGEAKASAPVGLVLTNLDSVTIKGIYGNKPPIFFNNKEESNVLVLEQCNNICLDNLLFKNAGGGDKKLGSFLVLKDCNNIIINNCQTRGFAAFGLEIYNSKNITVNQYQEKGSTCGLLKFKNVQNAQLINSQFKNGLHYQDLIQMSNCMNIEMNNLTIQNHTKSIEIDSSIALFSIEKSTNIQLKNSKLEKNDVDAFIASDTSQLKSQALIEKRNRYE